MLQDCPFSVKVDQTCRKSPESQERPVREGYAVEYLKLYKHIKLEDVRGKLLLSQEKENCTEKCVSCFIGQKE